MYTFTCQECHQEFQDYKSEKRIYCSKSCSASATGRGKKKTLGKHWKVKDTSKMKHNRYPYWSVGQKLSEQTKNKISEALSGEKNYQWKNETEVSYRTLHKWVEKQLGKACQCSTCGEVKKGKNIHWANISRKYHRNINDWLQLCAKCHAQYDNRSKRITYAGTQI